MVGLRASPTLCPAMFHARLLSSTLTSNRWLAHSLWTAPCPEEIIAAVFMLLSKVCTMARIVSGGTNRTQELAATAAFFNIST